MIRTGRDTCTVIFSNHKPVLARYLKGARKIVIISNPAIFALHGRDLLRKILPGRKGIIPLMIGEGERYKCQRTVNRIYDHFLDIGVERSDIITGFGGGVVGDTAGFAAATYKRGTRFVQIPTTLLAMVDASVGGKVAINHRLGKNLIGAFYQPHAVVINPEWLATLGSREMIEGMAEIIKAGFLSSLRLLNAAVSVEPAYDRADARVLASLIRDAVAFKVSVVENDMYDRGRRMILNFGHTFAHAIEKAEGYRRYRHGEAVLAGMAGALYLSHATGHLSAVRMREYLEYLTPFSGQLRRLKNDAGDYISPMDVDKKRRRGHRVFVLLEGIGRPVLREVRSYAKIRDSVNFMIQYVNNRGKL